VVGVVWRWGWGKGVGWGDGIGFGVELVGGVVVGRVCGDGFCEMLRSGSGVGGRRGFVVGVSVGLGL
jgi:hypothetical protein